MKKFSYILMTITMATIFIGCGGGGGGGGSSDGSTSSNTNTAGSAPVLVKATSNTGALNPPTLPGASTVPVNQIANN